MHLSLILMSQGAYGQLPSRGRFPGEAAGGHPWSSAPAAPSEGCAEAYAAIDAVASCLGPAAALPARITGASQGPWRNLVGLWWPRSGPFPVSAGHRRLDRMLPKVDLDAEPAQLAAAGDSNHDEEPEGQHERCSSEHKNQARSSTSLAGRGPVPVLEDRENANEQWRVLR